MRAAGVSTRVRSGLVGSGTWLGRHWPMLVIAGLAFAVRLVPVLRGGGLTGRGNYDPFVYYGAAAALSTGKLPYRDFLLLHPPGVLLALFPFTELGELAGDPIGMAGARLAWMAMGAVNAALIYLILYRRGRTAALVGAGLYAGWYPAWYVEHDVRLEGLATLLLLIALLLLGRIGARREPLGWVVLAGALLGYGALVKLWGLVPLAVVLVWLLVSHGVRLAAGALAGAAGVIGLVMTPFAIAAPNWLQLIVFAQLGRPRDDDDWQFRLRSLLGMAPVTGTVGTVAMVVAALLTVAAIVVACRTPTGRLHAALAVAGTAVLLAGPLWYPHYAAFVAAPLCLLYGTAAGVFLRRITARWLRVMVAAGFAAVLLAGVLALLGSTTGTRFPAARLTALLDGRPGCVTTDRTAVLVLTNTLRRNIARGCPVVVDSLGYRFAGQGTDASPAATRHRYQRELVDYLASGHSAVLVSRSPKSFEPELRARIESWPVIGGVGRYQVREPS